MKGSEMVSSRDVAEIVAQERTSTLEALRDMVAQDVAFLGRARSEGFDPSGSIRLAVTSEASDDGKPTLAAQGGSEGLPDEIFPRLTRGYTINYQATVRLTEIPAGNLPHLEGPTAGDVTAEEGGA